MKRELHLVRELRDLQTWFVQVATEEESALASIMRRQNTVPSGELEHVVRPGPTSSAIERIGIYHRSYFSRLTECLADDYPTLRFLVGQETFDCLCREYVGAFPSREGNLNRFGRNFASFIAGSRGPSWQFEVELAQLEWALVEALHARAPKQDIATSLASIKSDELPRVRFVVSPSVRLLAFGHPVNEFLRAYFRGQKPTKPDSNPTNVLVVRTGYEIWRFDLHPMAAQVLRCLVRGDRLEAALSGIDIEPEQVQNWFKEWTAHGVFEDVASGG